MFCLQNNKQNNKPEEDLENPETLDKMNNPDQIDTCIEQTMDLIKFYLIQDVRNEVDQLNKRIVKLEDRLTVLKIENEILRANATKETLAKIQTEQNCFNKNHPGSRSSTMAGEKVSTPKHNARS